MKITYLIFLFSRRNMRILNFIKCINHPYVKYNKPNRPDTSILCEDEIDRQKDLELIRAHKSVARKSKLRLRLEFILKLVFVITFYLFIIYTYRKQ